jgi:hypothetical protein
MMGPQEVPELKIQELPPPMLRNIDSGPREVSELMIREHPPSMLRNIDSGPREVPELKIRERPPSTLRNIDGGPPGGGPHLGFKRCVVNLHRHDRQRVILFTGLILSALSSFMAHDP